MQRAESTFDVRGWTMIERHKPNQRRTRTVIGKLSGEQILIPDSNPVPMPVLTEPGVILNGVKAEGFTIDPSRGYPDVRSFKRKFGLLIPASNTTMEHELWSVIVNNGGPGGLDGIGLHTSNIVLPKPQLRTKEHLLEYKRQFLEGLRAAVDTALLSEPQYLIMGMSLEHIISGLENIRSEMAEIESYGGLAWATWHDSIAAALKCYRAKRIGIITPFNQAGNESAVRMFEDLGLHVLASVGFSCANGLHIAHIPDWAKEKAILELLATDTNRLDAVVQCGTNMSLIDVAERLEPAIGIPILGINTVLFWYALRENGIDTVLHGAGRLMREF